MNPCWPIPYLAVCLSRHPILEPPISTPHCERLYGIFADAAKCDVFWNCWNGEASRYQCSPGLAYDREARVCMWADQVPECKNEGKLAMTAFLLSVCTNAPFV